MRKGIGQEQSPAGCDLVHGMNGLGRGSGSGPKPDRPDRPDCRPVKAMLGEGRVTRRVIDLFC